MADCRIVNAAVQNSVSTINTLSGQYKTAGATFVTSFTNAIADMQGDAKDALLELFNTSYKGFVSSEEEGIPAMIKGLGALLEANRKNFEDVDKQIADSIRNGGNQGN